MDYLNTTLVQQITPGNVDFGPSFTQTAIIYKSCCELSLLVQCTFGPAAQSCTVLLTLCYDNKNGKNLQVSYLGEFER